VNDYRLDSSNLSVSILPDTSGLTVTVTTSLPVDRPTVHAWGLKMTHRRLADRLRRAVLAGAVFGPARVVKDIYGRSYLLTATSVMGHTMNADLRRLGF
jgi:hypothetical protein